MEINQKEKFSCRFCGNQLNVERSAERYRSFCSCCQIHSRGCFSAEEALAAYRDIEERVNSTYESIRNCLAGKNRRDIVQKVQHQLGSLAFTRGMYQELREISELLDQLK